MKKVIDFFKNRIVISVIGLIFLSLVIWFVGPAIKFGSENVAPLGGQVARLLVIMVVIVLWGLNNLRISLQNTKNNAALVADLQGNQSSAQSIIADQRSEEIQIIGDRFSEALRTLQKLKFKGRGSRKALYELPWYIIIGPPGSGKTTALINSSLEFPLADQFGKEALRGVGGTRNCDWWFTNEAVLIDTAGRYTTQDSHKVIDSSAWDGFLDLLKRNRRRRPINGAIVAISVQELLMQTEDERIAHAKTIRTRIDELMEKLEIRFPIYLLFTKSDLVSGFSEFFEDMGKDDREQVWGVSLPNAPSPAQSPDFDYLETEYHNLVRRLYGRVLARIQQERDVNRRGAIQGFPQQMESFKDIALQFVKQTFAKNRYQYQPYLRGVYFTSGTQDGTPIDRLISSVSANFGFDRAVVQPRLGAGKSFFLGQLFKDVIFPESELVGANRKYEMIMRWTQRGAFLGLAALTILLIVIWAGSFARNEAYMHEVQGYIAEFNAEKSRRGASIDDVRDLLPTLGVLAKASAVYDKDSHPWLKGLGMYDGRVDAAADRAYESQLKTLLLPRLLKNMENQLRRGDQDGSLYDTFTTYMMFSKVDHLDKARVTDWFNTYWERELPGQAAVRGELKAHTMALMNLPLEPAELNKALVASVRAQLLQVPVAQRVYSRLRSKPEYANRVDLLNEFGEPVRTAYVNNDTVNQRLKIPALFTKAAYDSIDLSPRSDLIGRLLEEKWVLYDDDGAHGDFAKDDREGVAKEVKDLYLADYRGGWEGVLSALEVRPFDDIRQANDALLKFTDPVSSPLLTILKVSATNTTLTNQMAANLADDVKDGAKGKAADFLASQVKLTPVDVRFREMNQLLRETKDRPAQINGAIQKIRQMQEFVNEISIAPDPGKVAFEAAKTRYQGGAGNAITALMIYAKTMPEPINRWLQSLSNETWKVILQSAHGYANQEWKSQVQTVCANSISGRYPFRSDATSEVTLLDFTEFFKPGGVMDKFANDFLKPFVDTSGDWSNRGVDNRGLGISAGTLAQISRAQKIKAAFFSANPSVPSVSFQLRPYFMEKTVARVTLEVGDTRLTYNHGPKFWSTVNWVGSDDKNRVRLIFEDLSDQQHSVTYEGPWAWFRLQDRSKLEKTGVTNVYLATYAAANGNHSGSENVSVAGGHMVRYEIKGQSAQNPLNKDLLTSFRCPDGI
jgi:type VI secretion system protein ImpL